MYNLLVITSSTLISSYPLLRLACSNCFSVIGRSISPVVLYITLSLNSPVVLPFLPPSSIDSDITNIAMFLIEAEDLV